MAVLNRGAAGDAAARDRFRAAITAALPGGHGGGPWNAGPAGSGAQGPQEGGAPVVAAHPDGPAPWVATAYEPGVAGAERFLEAVPLQTAPPAARARRGPGFQPYWLGSGEPALERPRAAAAVAEGPPERSLVAAILALAAVLAGLALLLAVLFACQPVVRTPPVPPSEPAPVPTPSVAPPTSSPSPVPSTPGAPTATGGEGDGAPLSSSRPPGRPAG
ncbi:hypothetical protein ACRB68_68500 [Actinomadura sp. RB68]|uniref:Uncharacterized protein n=1 Tax=Actinomadura macrotermitis TaxID=2585200 RepID=A0A7K0C5L0_9ACTN|nr:hypothetical protein [Actinomadura macrotermitis]